MDRSDPETNNDQIGVTMPEVSITGWRKGCNTVAAIKEIREKALMPLNEALALVNQVLSNQPVTVFVLSLTAARALADSLERVGLAAAAIEEEQKVGRETP